jgi:hypothetical protein
MKLTKIITSINDNPTYRDFVPLVSKVWQKLFGLELIIGYVTDKEASDPAVRALEAYGDIRLFAPMEGVDSGVQAKVSRLALASSEEFVDENCMIVDIDMVPLTTEVLDVFEEVPENKLVKWGYDHPAFTGTPDTGKWPMDRTTAKGSLFRELINPKGLDYEDLLSSWKHVRRYGKESILLPFTGFSDESLLRLLYEDWDKRYTHTHLLSRHTLEDTMLCRRLDRSQPHMWENLEDKLKDNMFIEVHGIRPLKDNIDAYKEILTFFNLRIKDIWL